MPTHVLKPVCTQDPTILLMFIIRTRLSSVDAVQVGIYLFHQRHGVSDCLEKKILYMNTQKTIMFQSTIKNRNLPCFILQSSGSGAEASGEHQPVSVHLSHHQQPAGTLHYPRLRTRAPLPPKVSSTLRRDGDH